MSAPNLAREHGAIALYGRAEPKFIKRVERTYIDLLCLSLSLCWSRIVGG